MATHLNHTLQTSFEYDGTWWLAQDPDDQLSGKLSFSPEKGARLDLIGSFRQVPIASNQGFHSDFIIGVTDNGVECTLIDTYEIGRKTTFSGVGSHAFMANQLIIGAAFTNRDQLKFSHCQVSYDHIEEWITARPFKLDLLSEKEKFVGYQVQLVTQEVFRVYLALTDVEFSLSNRIGASDQNPMRMELTNEVFVKMASSVPEGLDVLQHRISDLGRLIGLLMGDITWPRKVHMTPLASNNEVTEEAPRTVSLFYRLVLASNNRRPHHHEMPVAFERFVPKLPAIVDHWLSHDPRFQPVKDLFFYTLYSGENSSINTILNLAHALEAYHRYKIGGQYVDNDTYESFREEIIAGLPNALPSDLRDALKGRIKYGNQYSFRKRLGSLLGSLEPQLRRLVTTMEKPFVKAVVATRNYYVHFDEEDEALAVKGSDILYLIQRLELLLRVFFMRELGFSDSEIHGMIVEKGRLLPWNRQNESYPKD